jgi:hypothetical protein
MTGPAIDATTPKAGWRTLWRFLPLLWPRGHLDLKARVIGAVVLVLAGKGVSLLMPFAYKEIVDGMAQGAASFAIVAGLVLAYCGGLFGSVVANNLRNAIFEKVGQRAARQLAGQVFRHVHDLSLRFHLERRTGSLTKIVERGTKSIDTMLYFILFNIAPTVIELLAICVIFFVKFGPGLGSTCGRSWLRSDLIIVDDIGLPSAWHPTSTRSRWLLSQCRHGLLRGRYVTRCHCGCHRNLCGRRASRSAPDAEIEETTGGRYARIWEWRCPTLRVRRRLRLRSPYRSACPSATQSCSTTRTSWPCG